ncbi:MAG: DUF2764 family protein [Thermodesulfobacteriota bacterium]
MKYYFLATYLPELSREDKRVRLGVADLLADRGLLADEDWREVDLVRLARDVVMVERLLAGRPVAVPQALHDLDFWREQQKAPSEGPDFIQAFLRAQAGGEFGPRQVDRLWAAYYDHVLEQSRNPLLRAWAGFERDLRNILAALRARRQGLTVAEHLVGDSDLVAALARANAEDFGLGRDYPWLERLMAAKEPQELQAMVDQILWDFLEQNTGADPFAFEAILAYLLKLMMVERRLALDEEAGMALVRQLEEA